MILLSMGLEKERRALRKDPDEASTKSTRILVFYRNLIRHVSSVLSTEASENDREFQLQ